MAYERSCQLNELMLCAKVSIAYLENKAVHPDLEKSIRYATKSCDGGVEVGCDFLEFIKSRMEVVK